MTARGVYVPGAFKLDHLQSSKQTFVELISTFLTGHMQHFPCPAYSEMDTPQCTPKVNNKGCMTMGHSNWNICSLT